MLRKSVDLLCSPKSKTWLKCQIQVPPPALHLHTPGMPSPASSLPFICPPQTTTHPLFCFHMVWGCWHAGTHALTQSPQDWCRRALQQHSKHSARDLCWDKGCLDCTVSFIFLVARRIHVSLAPRISRINTSWFFNNHHYSFIWHNQSTWCFTQNERIDPSCKKICNLDTQEK